METNKQKIGIITFHCAENYGAFLQTYALQEWLNKYESGRFQINIVDYRPDYLLNPYKIRIGNRLSLVTGVFNKIKAIVLFGVEIPNKVIRKYKFHKAWNVLQLTKKKYKTQKFILDDEYYAVILGSDQIWNPNITMGLDPVYFGAIEGKRCRKIAYAASIGVKSYSEKEKGKLTKLLNEIDGIGVREQTSVDVIQPLCKQEVVVNADPTILVDRQIWKILLRPVKEQGYILIYQLQKNSSIFKDAYDIAKRTGRIILHFGDPGLKPMFSDIKVKSLSYCGPYEFLSYINNADLVLTNSFHATCFSILFERSFFTYLQENRSERIRSIAEIGHFEDRIVEYGDRLNLKESEWDKLTRPDVIYSHLQELREKSQQYLVKQLSKEGRFI